MHPSTCLLLSDGCDSYRFALLNDVDGTFGGTAGSSIISATNPQLALSSPDCNPMLGSEAYYCPGMHHPRALSQQCPPPSRRLWHPSLYHAC